jgi:uncharacterized protein YjbI with pentapeptide repeats
MLHEKHLPKEDLCQQSIRSGELHSMITGRAKEVGSVWAKRWAGKKFVLEGPSPFGNTATGTKDSRGVNFVNERIANLEINNVDFSAANFHHLRVDNCAFFNCNFERAILTQLVTRSSRFDTCQFRKANLTMAQIGYAGTDFDNCSFDGVKVARAGFFNAVFSHANFDGKYWSHVDFCASGFWNCSFRGMLKDIIFRGSYLFPYQMEISGEPQRTGLHNVDFTTADLHWVGAYNGCKLENIVLPANGSAFICDVYQLLSFYAKLDVTSKDHEVMSKYFKIIRPDASIQTEQIISKF